MIKHSYLVWVVALVLGWGADFLFWGKPVGISLPIYLTACLLGGGLVLLASGIKPALKSLWLVALFFFFAIISSIRLEPLTLGLGIAGAFISLGLLAVTYRGGGWASYRLSDYFRQALTLVVSIISLPIEFYRQTRPDTSWARRIPIKGVLRGVLIALPVLVIFLALLSAGDVYFGEKVNDAFHQVFGIHVPEQLLRLVIILAVTYALSGVILHAGLKSDDGELVNPGKPLVRRFLGFTEAAVIMGSISLLFLVFVIFQFRYFFGGQALIDLGDYTYSEYARSGFNELISVAFLSLLVIIGLGSLTQREASWQKRVYSGLSVGIALLVIVILVSAYQRLMLAISWHGFSRLRLYPNVFLIWVGVLFVAVIVLEVLRRERHFALAMLLAAFGFAITLSILNVDAAIARHNSYVFNEERPDINVNYLTTLSTDAIPGLVQAFNDPGLSEFRRTGVGAALKCYLQSSWYKDYDWYTWRGFSYSRRAAVNALNQVAPSLQGYQVNEPQYRGQNYEVTTPDGKISYPCDQHSPRYRLVPELLPGTGGRPPTIAPPPTQSPLPKTGGG